MRNTYINKIFAAVLIAAPILFASCGGSKAGNNGNANAAAQTVDVTTALAIVKQIPTYFEATGNLASDAQTDVAPAVSGKIVAVNFDIGSYVEKGSVLIQLDDRDARIRLDQARAQVDQAEANVDQAVAALRQTQVRLGVKDGETFLVKDFSQVKSVTAQLTLAEKELTRAERLYQTGDTSRQNVEQRRSQRDALIGQLDEARSNAAVAIKAIDTSRAQVETAKSAVGTAKTQVSQAQKALGDTAVYAPISGYVSERTADLGEYISPNTPNAKVATIVRTAVLRMKIDVPEQSISKIAVGQGISAQVSAYPDRSFAGTVVRVAPTLNATSRTLTVEAEIENVGGLLKPGQFATVRITQSKPEPAVMIPVAAVRTEGDINKVFVIKDGFASERLVQLGLLENDLIEIKQGVAENEAVATSNVNLLKDGVMVRQ